MTVRKTTWELGAISVALVGGLLILILSPDAGFPTGEPTASSPLPPEDAPDSGPIPIVSKPRPAFDRELREVLGRIPEDELLDLYPDEAYRKLVRMRDSRVKHASPGRVAEARRLLEETNRHRVRLHEDRTYRQHSRWRTAVRLDPGYTRYHSETVSRPPYLLFLFERSRSAVARPKAERLAATLLRLHDEFHRRVGEALELPRLSDPPQSHESVLKVAVFPSLRSLGKHQRGIGRPLESGVGWSYTPLDQWVTFAIRDGDESDETVTILDCRRLVRVATHQLLHAYAKIMLKSRLDAEVEWEDRRLDSRRLWLREGFADLLAGAYGPGDEPFDFGTPLRFRLEVWREALDCEKPDWSLAELLGISSRRDLYNKSKVKRRPVLGNWRELDWYLSLAYAQSWAFCHFLWNHEDGKYRGKLIEALRGELTNRSTPADWDRIWTGGEGKPDWAAVEREWREYVAELPG